MVVSSDAYHRDRPDIIVAAVTSRVGRPRAVGDVLVEDWQSAGLLKASMLKPVFATIEQGLIIQKLGTLQPKDALALRKALQEVIG